MYEWLSKIGGAFVKSDLFVGVGAGLLCFSTILLQNSGPTALHSILRSVSVSSFYVFGIHILNHFTDPEYAQYKESYKLSFLRQHRNLLISLGAISLLASVTLSWFIGLAPFIILLFASISGVTYNFRIVPAPIARIIRINRLRDIPASKNLLMALAWCAITAFVPVFEMHKPFSAEIWRQLAIVFVFTFTIVFTRSTLLDIRDIQGDLMVGDETLPILLGKKLTKIIVLALLLICSIALFAATFRGWVSKFGYFLLIPIGYCFAYLFLYHKRRFYQGMSTEIAANASFFVAGAVALIYYFLTI